MKMIRNALQAFRQAYVEQQNPKVRMQVEKPKSRYNYRSGPMYYLGEQIVAQMEKAGYPAKIHKCYRTPEEQDRMYVTHRSKARRFESPHQFYEAVDIIHPKYAWFEGSGVPKAEQAAYWRTLKDCGLVVAEKFGVELVFGYDWGWDSAHIELKDWRTFRKKVGKMVPTQDQLDRRFASVLPEIWARYLDSAAAQGKSLYDPRPKNKKAKAKQ